MIRRATARLRAWGSVILTIGRSADRIGPSRSSAAALDPPTTPSLSISGRQPFTHRDGDDRVRFPSALAPWLL